MAAAWEKIRELVAAQARAALEPEAERLKRENSRLKAEVAYLKEQVAHYRWSPRIEGGGC